MKDCFKTFTKKKEKHEGKSQMSPSDNESDQDNARGVDTSGTVFSRMQNKLPGSVSSKVVKTLRFVCISDTHSGHDQMKHEIPDGDVLIHAGDFTLRGLLGEVNAFNKFIGSLPHKYKIVIAGNHEHCLNSVVPSAANGTFPDGHVQCNEQLRKHSSVSDTRKLLSNCIYLQDEAKEIEGIRIYGSPWTIEHGTCAFACDSAMLKCKWDAIPTDVDVLITHSPPFGVCDKTHRGKHAGCKDLASAVTGRIKPKCHIFGHIHEGYGTFQTASMLFINASICTKAYEPVNKPVMFELEITPGYGNKDKISLKFDKS